jgi:hypothetical protein
MKIAIFGASVSAQHVSSGVAVGYAEFLRRNHMANLGATEIVQFAYPGNRLADGGMIRIRDVVDYAPDVCIVEPIIEDRSRGQDASASDLLYVYDTLVRSGILPVTLLLPWPPEYRAYPIYAQIQRLCENYQLPRIEFDIPVGFDTEAGFDNVHTRPIGGSFYADEISKGLRAIGDPAAAVTASRRNWPSLTDLPKLSSCTLPPLEEVRRIDLDIVPHGPGELQFRLIQPQRIGPFSPQLDVTIEDSMGGTISKARTCVWDQYCHYMRESCVSLAAGATTAARFRVTIAVSAEPPNRESCRREGIGWPLPAELHLEPADSIYLIGNRSADLIVVACY